jgi:GntR family transcriptional regulator/MocR family aminotransferase
MEPALDLPIRLPPRGSRDRLGALHRQLRAAILDGRLTPGLRLPATRALAEMLGVSRNTALAAYDLLLSEGYLVARPRAGNFVADVLPRARQATRTSEGNRRLVAHWQAASPAASPSASYRFDFRIGLPDKTSFPFQVWRRLSARALRALSKAPSAYAPPEGQAALREAIARHVSFARAVACEADDIVVTSGAQQAFDLLGRILVTPGRTKAAIESPCYPPLRAALAAAGADIAPVPVDDEGLVVDRLPADTRIVCVTPSHQFPLGVAMSARRRAHLLEFARANRAVVIEDDYDGEFRYAGRPLDALQTLDRADSVFYVGTFSKSLFPALRLGFVVSPPWARAALVRAKQLTDWHGAVLAQDTLAAFISEGHLARHVRKMRRVYGERRAILLRALAGCCGDTLRPLPGETGLHLAARLIGRTPAEEIVAEAERAGIGLQTLRLGMTGRSVPNGVAFGYGMIRSEQIEPAIRRLAEIIRAQAPARSASRRPARAGAAVPKGRVP